MLNTDQLMGVYEVARKLFMLALLALYVCSPIVATLGNLIIGVALLSTVIIESLSDTEMSPSQYILYWTKWWFSLILTALFAYAAFVNGWTIPWTEVNETFMGDVTRLTLFFGVVMWVITTATGLEGIRTAYNERKKSRR